MKIKRKSTPILSELTFTFVENLIMANFTCRDQMIKWQKIYSKRIKVVSKEDSTDS